MVSPDFFLVGHHNIIVRHRPPLSIFTVTKQDNSDNHRLGRFGGVAVSLVRRVYCPERGKLRHKGYPGGGDAPQ